MLNEILHEIIDWNLIIFKFIEEPKNYKKNDKNLTYFQPVFQPDFLSQPPSWV